MLLVLDVGNQIRWSASPPAARRRYQIVLSRGLADNLHVGMITRKPDLLNVTDGTPGSSYTVTMRIYFQEILRDELDSAFVESKSVAEVTCVCDRCRSRDVDISLHDSLGRHGIPWSSD